MILLHRASFWLAGLCLAALLPLDAGAQDRIVKIGLVSFQGPQLESQLKYFRSGMSALGHNEGKAYELEAHFANGDAAKARKLVLELIAKPVDIFIARDTPV